MRKRETEERERRERGERGERDERERERKREREREGLPSVRKLFSVLLLSLQVSPSI